MNEPINGTAIARKKSELSVKEVVALSAWLSSNAAQMRTTTRTQRCGAVKQALGIDLTDSQLGRVESELGYEFHPLRSSSKAAGVKHLDRTAMLAHALLALFYEVGSKAPEYLRKIASHESAQELLDAYNAFRANGGKL